MDWEDSGLGSCECGGMESGVLGSVDMWIVCWRSICIYRYTYSSGRCPSSRVLYLIGIGLGQGKIVLQSLVLSARVGGALQGRVSFSWPRGDSEQAGVVQWSEHAGNFPHWIL